MHLARFTSDTPVARHLHITGRVQDAYFRDSMALQADALGVCGWVRDRRDGSVEAMACGPASALRALIDWAHRGPPNARVHRVAVSQADTADVLIGFEQRDPV
jgi:acylphosphatase